MSGVGRPNELEGEPARPPGEGLGLGMGDHTGLTGEEIHLLRWFHTSDGEEWPTLSSQVVPPPRR